MNLTNNLQLPEPLVRAVANDSYNGATASDYTTTGLLRPPRIAALLKQHGEHLTEDVSDRIFSLFGQIVHSIIERAATDELVEKRLFMEIDGKTISGQIDLYQNSILWDWKTTTIYAGKDGAKEEWIQQGNINRLLCHENDIEVRGIQYVALYRDWSLLKAQREHDYPKKQVEVFNLPVWPYEKARQFVEERIRLHEEARERLPLCSASERWERPTKWALMKKGQKRAIKLYDTEDEATAAISDPRQYVEFRQGEPVRCLNYCPVTAYCSQAREYLQERAA